MDVKVNIGLISNGSSYKLKPEIMDKKDSLSEITEIVDKKEIPQLESVQGDTNTVLSNKDGKVIVKGMKKVIIKDNENL